MDGQRLGVAARALAWSACAAATQPTARSWAAAPTLARSDRPARAARSAFAVARGRPNTVEVVLEVKRGASLELLRRIDKPQLAQILDALPASANAELGSRAGLTVDHQWLWRPIGNEELYATRVCSGARPAPGVRRRHQPQPAWSCQLARLGVQPALAAERRERPRRARFVADRWRRNRQLSAADPIPLRHRRGECRRAPSAREHEEEKKEKGFVGRRQAWARHYGRAPTIDGVPAAGRRGRKEEARLRR